MTIQIFFCRVSIRFHFWDSNILFVCLFLAVDDFLRKLRLSTEALRGQKKIFKKSRMYELASGMNEMKESRVLRVQQPPQLLLCCLIATAIKIYGAIQLHL